MPVGKLPVDYDSIAFSQQQLNDYFSEVSSKKRLVITQRHGTERLELRNATDLSIWETICSFFGFGPASFKNVMAFCVDRCLSHKKLKIMIRTYNEQHASYKKVDSLVERVLKKNVIHPLVRAAQTQNIEVLSALKNMSWDEARPLFIKDNGNATGFFLEICNPAQQHADVVEFFIKFINKAPPQDCQTIYNAKDEKGRTAFFLLTLQMTNLSESVTDLIQPHINQQDNEGKTALMHLFQDQYSLLHLESLLKFKPLLSVKDIEGRNILFYIYNHVLFRISADRVDTLIAKKRDLILTKVEELEEKERKEVLNSFFGYRDAEGRSEYQRLLAENLPLTIITSQMMDVKKRFNWQDDGWKESIEVLANY